MVILITFPSVAVSETEAVDVEVEISPVIGNQKLNEPQIPLKSKILDFSTDHVTEDIFDFDTISLEAESSLCAVILWQEIFF